MYRIAIALILALTSITFAGSLQVERVTTRVYFPRGLVETDEGIIALARGRVRGYGGASPAIMDEAGTLYLIDPDVAQPIGEDVTDAVANNGRIIATPTSPPFKLYDRSLANPADDRNTDRPYCCMRYDPISQNLIIGAFSGIDLPRNPNGRSFSKNLTDAILRYDLRTKQWHELERHDRMAGGNYPHHDPAHHTPPHGWLSGPDNLAVHGRWLYACAKDNSVVARYDLAPLRDDPNAPPPPSTWVIGSDVAMRGADGSVTMQRHLGYSALAVHGDYLYAGTRTSSTILRLPLDDDGTLTQPPVGELVAQFEPYDAKTGRSANLTDMAFDAQGRLYVISAQPSRVYRFTPDPAKVYDATGDAKPWADMATITGNAKMKSENLLIDKHGRVYITSGDSYGHNAGYAGAIYRVTETE